MAQFKSNLTVLGTDNLNTNPTALDASVTQTSGTVDLATIDSNTIQLVLPTATSLSGSLAFQFSNYAYSGVIPSYGWATSSLYPNITITTQTGSYSQLLSLNPLNYRFMRLVWTPSAGTGTILCLAVQKTLQQ